MACKPPDDIINVLNTHNRFVLSSHARPDGDSVGSQLALAHAMHSLGKSVRIVNHDAPPLCLHTLPGIDSIEVSASISDRADAAVILECSSLQRTEISGLERQTLINIDHHAGNEMYGTHNWFDGTAAACAEQVYDIIIALGVSVTQEIGMALYAGILTDTGSFRHANITARTFNICQHVAASGVDVSQVAAEIYQSSSLGKIKLIGKLLDGMQLESDGRIAVLNVDDALLRQTGCPPDDIEGLINLPLSAKVIEAVIMIKAHSDLTRVSLRSKTGVDVRAVAKAFGGGGHNNASGFSTPVAAAEIEPQVIAKVHDALAQVTPLDSGR